MRTSSSLKSQRGSVLIVSLIFSMAIAVSVGSYVSLCLNTNKLNNHSYHMTAAMNVAEAGLEQAIWSINQLKVASNPNAFDGWTTSGSNAKKEFTDFILGQNTSGKVQVLVSNYNGVAGAPRITSRALLTLPDGKTVEKWVEVTLSKRSRFSTGLVAKDKIVFNGNNPSVDSWNSDPDRDPTTPAVPYSSGTRNDNGSVGSVSVEVNVVNVQNADIWGYVSTAASDPTTSVKNNGSIMGEDSAAKDKSGWAKSNVDPDRVSTDFTASLDVEPAPSNPSIPLGVVGTTITLPRTGDTPDANGKYYYNAATIKLTNSQVNISGGNVVLVVPSPYEIDIGGNSGGINIANGSSLAIYAGGNVKIAGQGIANGEPLVSGGVLTASTVQQPANFQLWGTAIDSDNNPTTTHQNISIAGNGALSGIVFAPNADLTINGNGDVLGSAIANKVTIVGNAAFHYDESLALLDSGSPYGIILWRELLNSVDKTLLAAEF